LLPDRARRIEDNLFNKGFDAGGDDFLLFLTIFLRVLPVRISLNKEFIPLLGGEGFRGRFFGGLSVPVKAPKATCSAILIGGGGGGGGGGAF